MKKENEDLLKEGLDFLSISYSEGKLEQLKDFANLLIRWNKVYNLTSIRDERDIVIKHLLDSATIAKEFPVFASHLGLQGAGKRVLDVGCGGGFPGIPSAVLFPEISFDLIDTVSKKIQFVRQAIVNLGLKNASALNQRVENLEAPPYPLITSRAFSSLENFAGLTRNVIAPRGLWLAMKGKEPTDEIKALPSDIRVVEIKKLHLPFEQDERCLIVMSLNS